MRCHVPHIARSSLAVLPALTLLAAQPARATPVEYAFSGTVMAISGSLTGVNATDTVTGTVYYDASATPDAGSNGILSTFTFAPGYTLSVNVDGHTITAPLLRVVANDNGGSAVAAAYTLGIGYGAPTIDGVSYAAGRMTLGGVFGQWSSGATVLPATPDLPFGSGVAMMVAEIATDLTANPALDISLRITSISAVPEPAMAALMAMGLGGLIMVRRRRA